MSSHDFRRELTMVMPGYSWTIHRRHPSSAILRATGTQSSGFNRLSTLLVNRIEMNDGAVYEVKSAGYGAKATWEGTATNTSLRRALRDLQNFYELEANKFRALVRALERGRITVATAAQPSTGGAA